MYRLDHLPALKTLTTSIEAEYYNLVRLGLRRLGNPLRVPLPGMGGLELYLADRQWVCLDREQETLPLLAWDRFHHPRLALHEPVSCRLRLYHPHASMLVSIVFEFAAPQLRERMARLRGAR